MNTARGVCLSVCVIAAGVIVRAPQWSSFFIRLLCHHQIVDLDWWPVSRDCLMYGVAVVSLIGVLCDGIVMWYEALALVMGYIFYIVGE